VTKKNRVMNVVAKVKGTYVPIQTMEAYRESRFVAALILNLSTQ
jgi:hypothetical protein